MAQRREFPLVVLDVPLVSESIENDFKWKELIKKIVSDTNRYVCGGTFSVSGTVLNTFGTEFNCSVSRISAGTYQVLFNNSIDTILYTINLSATSADVRFSSKASTGFIINVTEPVVFVDFSVWRI